jgi:hypothetical protein
MGGDFVPGRALRVRAREGARHRSTSGRSSAVTLGGSTRRLPLAGSPSKVVAPGAPSPGASAHPPPRSRDTVRARPSGGARADPAERTRRARTTRMIRRRAGPSGARHWQPSGSAPAGLAGELRTDRLVRPSPCTVMEGAVIDLRPSNRAGRTSASLRQPSVRMPTITAQRGSSIVLDWTPSWSDWCSIRPRREDLT